MREWVWKHAGKGIRKWDSETAKAKLKREDMERKRKLEARMSGESSKEFLRREEE